MKKFLSICCLSVFAVFMFGCAPQQSEREYAGAGLNLSVFQGSYPHSDRYLYNSFTEAKDIPVLDLDEVYYLEVLPVRGYTTACNSITYSSSARQTSEVSVSSSPAERIAYSALDIAYDETQILVQEMPEYGCPPYILKGLKKGAAKIDVTWHEGREDCHRSIFVIFA